MATIRAIPASESTLILFATHLATTGILHASIKVYLSAVRHMHIMRGLHSEFNQQLTLWPNFILKGIKRQQASTHSPRITLPITIHILHKIHPFLSNKQPSYSNVMLG